MYRDRRKRGLWIWIALSLILAIPNSVCATGDPGDASPGTTLIRSYLPQLEGLAAARQWQRLEQTARTLINEFANKLGPDAIDVADAYSWLGEALEAQNKFSDADAVYRQASAIYVKDLGEFALDVPFSSEWQDTTASGLDDLYHDPARAEPYYRRSLAIQEAYNALRPFAYDAVTRKMDDVVQLLQKLGKLTEAETLARRAMQYAQTQRIASGLPGAAWYSAETRPLADVLVAEHKYSEAIPIYRQVVDADQRFRQDPNYKKSAGDDLGDADFGLVDDIVRLAGLYDLTRQPTLADPLFQQAATIAANAGSDNWPTVLALEALGGEFRSHRRYAQAEKIFQREVLISNRIFGKDDIWPAMAEQALAYAQEQQGEFLQAIQSYRPACARLDQTLPSAAITSNEAVYTNVAAGMSHGMGAWCSHRLALTDWASSIRGPRGDDTVPALQADAFLAAQTASASTVDEAIAQASAYSLAQKEGAGDLARKYEAAINALDAQSATFENNFETSVHNPDAYGAPASSNPSPWTLIHDNLRDLEADLRTKAPLYWAYRVPHPVPLDALQATSGADANLIHDNEALVFWMLPEREDDQIDSGLVFAVSKHGFACAEIKITKEQIQSDVTAIRNAIDPPQGVPSAFPREISHDLYVALLGDPKIQSVIGAAGIDTLLLVPTGALTSLPLSLLVVDEPKGSDSDPESLASTHWLFEDKAMAVLPAVDSLRTIRTLLPALHARPSLPLLALADPDFRGSGEVPKAPSGETTFRGGMLADARTFERGGRGSDELKTLPPLYGTLFEGQSIAQSIAPNDPSALLLGPEASKSNLLQRQANGSLAQTRIVVFSTHALLSGEFAGLDEPALALARPRASNAADDGLLKASEAAALTLNADWVVLSACNTAAADGQGAQGLSGLAKAFFHAGASTLLVSHWRVDDAATTRLITETFRVYAKNGGPPANGGGHKAQALRQAMLELLNDPSHAYVAPRFWAPFVIVGEPN